MTCSTHNAVYRPRIFILYGVFFSVFTKGKRNTWTFLLGRGHFILPGWAEPCFSLFFSRLCDPLSEPITASPAFPSCVSRTSIPTSLPVLYKIVCVRFEIDVQQLSMRVWAETRLARSTRALLLPPRTRCLFCLTLFVFAVFFYCSVSARPLLYTPPSSRASSLKPIPWQPVAASPWKGRQPLCGATATQRNIRQRGMLHY